MQLRVSATTKQIKRRLNDIGDATVHAKPALVEIGKVVATDNRAKWGKGWKRNAPSTLAKKAKAGQGSEPLTATGKTKAQLTNAEKMTLRLTDSELRLGTQSVGAHFAKTGTKHEPKRNPLRVGKQVRKDAAEIVARHSMKER